jgi:hypothetical protein
MGGMGSAAAQGPVPVPAPAAQADPPGYRALVDEAVTEHRAGHFGEARALFTRAHALYPNARTLKGLGMAEFELRNYRESAQYLEASLASTVKPLTPELRSETEQLLARAQGFLGKVRVLVSPSTTQITVDGVVAPFGADGSVLLAAGDHVLEATAAGHESSRQTIKINGGDDQTVTFQLTPSAAVPPPAAAMPVVATTLPAETPPATSGAKPHGVKLYAGGLIGVAGHQSGTLEVEGFDETAELSDSLDPSYGFDLGATFLSVPYFDLGAEFRLGWIKPKDTADTSTPDDVEVERSLLIDIDVKPRLRFDFAQGRGEFYIAVPIGLTIPSLPAGVTGNVGWNLGTGAGVTYFVSDHFGLNLEAMVLFHSYSGSEDAYDDQSGETYQVTAGLFLWQPSLFLNLVLAP